jgi:hypothetical protein
MPPYGREIAASRAAWVKLSKWREGTLVVGAVGEPTAVAEQVPKTPNALISEVSSERSPWVANEIECPGGAAVTAGSSGQKRAIDACSG